MTVHEHKTRNVNVEGKHLKYAALVLGTMLLSGLIFSRNASIISILLVTHAATSFALRGIKKLRIGIEMNLLITVLGAFVYGAKVGALLGVAAMLIDYVFSLRLSYFAIVTTAAYALIGFFAGFSTGISITTVGIAAAIAYNISTSFIIVMFMGGHIDKCVRFGLTNIALNAVLFSTIAPTLLKLMGG